MGEKKEPDAQGKHFQRGMLAMKTSRHVPFEEKMGKENSTRPVCFIKGCAQAHQHFF